MEDLNLQYVLLAVLGMVIHILMKIGERGNKKGNPFSFKVFFADRMNWIRIALSITSVLALMLMAEDLTDTLGITLSDGSPARSIFSFGAGYLNHSLIRNILKRFKTESE
jgi:hypothetical protein